MLNSHRYKTTRTSCHHQAEHDLRPRWVSPTTGCRFVQPAVLFQNPSRKSTWSSTCRYLHQFKLVDNPERVNSSECNDDDDWDQWPFLIFFSKGQTLARRANESLCRIGILLYTYMHMCTRTRTCTCGRCAARWQCLVPRRAKQWGARLRILFPSLRHAAGRGSK